MLAELIPESFFLARPIWMLWPIAAVAIALLVAGADRLVGSAVKLATALGMSTVIIGATVVSLGTTAPETFVSVTAAFDGKPGLALGNGVGSMICNMAMIFGIAACLTSLPKDRSILNRHGWLLVGAGALLTLGVFALAGLAGSFRGVVLPRWMGLTMVGLLAVYLYLSVRWARAHPEALPAEVRAQQPKTGPRAILLSLLGLALGLGLLVFGAPLLVGSVGRLCEHYGVPPNVLAVTLIALGTSLPELVTAIMSILKGHPELLVGNIVGANILNVLFVVGASATAVPLKVPVEFFYLHLPVMMLSLLLFRLYVAWPGERFHRWFGLPLLVLFAGYYTTLLVLVHLGVLRLENL